MKYFIYLLIILLSQSCKKKESVDISVSEQDVELTNNNCEVYLWNESINYDTIKDVEGNKYRTVKIGTQCWMAENLRVTKYSNGDNILQIESDSSWSNLNIESDAYSKSEEGSIEGLDLCYGNYYNFQVVIDDRNVCPENWRVPSDDDWLILEDFILNSDSKTNLGEALKAVEGWEVFEQFSGGGNDVFGFRALPSGQRTKEGVIASYETSCSWWTSSENQSNDAWSRGLFNDSKGITRHTNHKNNGFSIRCIKD